MRARAAAALLAALLVFPLAALRADARTLSGSGDRALGLRTSLKANGLWSGAPEGSDAADEVSQFLGRARFEVEWRNGPSFTGVVAYESTWRASSSSIPSLLPTDVLPGTARAPYRIRPLESEIAGEPGVRWLHEIDRAFVALHGSRTELTLGRQAIGWGRGVLYGAVDLFVPFWPLQADRDWRPGVDAVRIDRKVGARSSAEAVGAFGPSLDESILAGRIRGYEGDVDAEIMGGRRAEDWFAGGTASAAIGGAELHAEAAYFRLPEPIPDSGEDVWKAVVGASRQIAVGHGLPIVVEYHYSGFGVAEAAGVPARLADESFLARYLRGDTQILSRHAAALWATYEVSPELSAAATLLVAPTDGSGVLEPALTIQAGNRFTLRGSLYWPFGRGLDGGVPASFYGATPRSVWLQLAFFD